MPVVPTSQIRVAPQAPRVDTGAFIPKADPTGGLGIFTEAAKLPLMFETLDIQRARNKAEKSTLDLKQKELDFTAKNFDAIQAANRAASEQKLANEQVLEELKRRGLEADLELKEQSVAQGRPAPQEQVDRLRGSGMSKPAAAPGAAPSLAPLAGEVSATKDSAQQAAPSQSKASPAYVPGSFEVEAFTNEDPDEMAQKEFSYEIGKLLPTEGPTAAEYKRAEAAAPEIRERVAPKNSTITVTDSHGIPVKVPVITVNGKVARQRPGSIRIDLKTLYDERPGQRALDEAAGKRFGQEAPEEQVALAMTTERVDAALDAYQKVLSGGSLNVARMAELFLPESIAKGLAPDAMFARDQVRTAIQGSLKQVLGGAFTKAEAEALMARAFNIWNTPEQTFLLLKQAVQVAETAARDAREQREYFYAHGTLAGFDPNGTRLVGADSNATIARIEAAMAEEKRKAEESSPFVQEGSGPMTTVTPVQRQTAIDFMLGRKPSP